MENGISFEAKVVSNMKQIINELKKAQVEFQSMSIALENGISFDADDYQAVNTAIRNAKNIAYFLKLDTDALIHDRVIAARRSLSEERGTPSA